MKKRILACLLALVMLIGAMPVMALAAEPEAENWEVSKSKTATALDADGSTRVTLSAQRRGNTYQRCSVCAGRFFVCGDRRSKEILEAFE